MNKGYLFAGLIFLILLVGGILLVTDLENPPKRIFIEDEQGNLIELSSKYTEATYDEKINELVISNDGIKIARARLLTPLNVNVIRGEDVKVAEFEVESYYDILEFFGDMEFFNVKETNAKINRTFNYKYRILEDTYDNPIFGGGCEMNHSSGSPPVCNRTIIGYQTIPVYDWRILEKSKLDKLPKGNITIGIFTDVEPNDYVEWIPTFTNEKVVQWATWTESLKQGLTLYYQFNNSKEEIYGQNNLTVVGTPSYRIPLVPLRGLSGFTETGQSHRWTIPNAPMELGNMSNATLNFWVYNLTGLVSGNGILFDLYGSGTREIYFYKYPSYMAIAGYSANMETGTINNGNSANWFMFTLVVGAERGRVHFYMNGTLKANITLGASTMTAGGTMYFFNNYATNQHLYGNIDELGYWNRSLSASEISTLYDNGLGTFYESSIIPTVAITYPVNQTVYSTSISLLNYTFSQGVDCWYSTNKGATNSSHVACGVNFTGVTSVGGWNNWTVYVNSSSNEIRSNRVDFFINDTITTELYYPPNNYATSTLLDQIFRVNATATGSLTLKNMTFYVWNSSNHAVINTQNRDITGTFNSTDFYVNFTTSGNYTWTVLSYSTNAIYSFLGGNRTFYIDNGYPIVRTAFNLSNLTVKTYPAVFNWNYSSSNAVSPLSSCYYYTSENPANVSVTCNTPKIQTNFTSDGIESITYCANNSVGLLACNTSSFDIFLLGDTAFASTNQIGEGGQVRFSLHVNMTGITTTTATFKFNGVDYTPDVTYNRANSYQFEKLMTLPYGSGNSSGKNYEWNWTYSIEGKLSNTSSQSYNLTVFSIVINNCTTPLNYTILTFNLRDEGTTNMITPNATLNSLVELDLLVSSSTNSSLYWNYSKKWMDEATGAVCFSTPALNFTNYTIDYTWGYSATGYVEEFNYLDNGILSKHCYFNPYTSCNLNFYDLKLDDSTTFLFEFLDEDGLEVDDIIVHTYRKYIGDGVFREVERSIQDDSGQTHIHVVEEDVIYYFMITQYGNIIYTSTNYNAKCLSTLCSITLDAQEELELFPTRNPNFPNGTYAVIVNDTARSVTLGFTLNTTSAMNLTVYKMSNERGVLDKAVASDVEISSNGYASVIVPYSYDNVTFYAEIRQDGRFVDRVMVDLRENPSSYFGVIGMLLTGIMVLLFVLIGLAYGELLVVFVVVAVLLSGAMYLVKLPALAVISIICVGALILYKTMGRGR